MSVTEHPIHLRHLRALLLLSCLLFCSLAEGATYYVDGAVGADGNLGTSEGAGNAWQTCDKAMNTVSPGDMVYVKASATYGETATIDTLGTNAAPIAFIGYTSTTTDGGVVTITGGGVRANCLAETRSAGDDAFYVFRNFRFTAGTGNNVELGDLDYLTFVNCRFDSAGAYGGAIRQRSTLVGCTIDTNGTYGISISGTETLIYGCDVYDNGTRGINVSAGVSIAFCRMWGLDTGGEPGLYLTAGGYNPAIVSNCTIDGEVKGSTLAIQCGTSLGLVLINTVITRCGTAGTITGSDARLIVRNNCIYDNTSRGTLPAGENEVAADPLFFAPDANPPDYRIAFRSPCRAAGWPDYLDIGAMQRKEPARWPGH